jgi:uncharacterized spore protein YtfJ
MIAIPLLTAVSTRLKALAKSNAVVARTISVGDRHVLPLCELAVGFGGGGGDAQGGHGPASGKGSGGVGAGMARAAPVAVIIVEGGQVRIESLDR